MAARLRYAVVRIDNGLHQPHTGLVKSFRTESAAQNFIDRANKRLHKTPGYGSAWHPYAILDRESGEKRNPEKRKSTAKRVTSALKKFLKGQKNPAGKAVRLKNFTGTVLRTPRGQVIIRGRGKR